METYSKYKLITYYNRGTESDPIWNVYGHLTPGANESIGSFSTEADAMKAAHSHGVPVMRGDRSPAIQEVLQKLLGEN